jgi:hypothetical protein
LATFGLVAAGIGGAGLANAGGYCSASDTDFWGHPVASCAFACNGDGANVYALYVSVASGRTDLPVGGSATCSGEGPGCNGTGSCNAGADIRNQGMLGTCTGYANGGTWDFNVDVTVTCYTGAAFASTRIPTPSLCGNGALHACATAPQNAAILRFTPAGVVGEVCAQGACHAVVPTCSIGARLECSIGPGA